MADDQFNRKINVFQPSAIIFAVCAGGVLSDATEALPSMSWGFGLNLGMFVLAVLSIFRRRFSVDVEAHNG